ncbi:MAG: hypothetical protein GY936_08105 [Ignavibacteriae bacterium]|nr:hypothetical protein [Ignavibacteriota bacterium]
MEYNKNQLNKSIDKLEKLKHKIERKNNIVGLSRLFSFFGGLTLTLLTFFYFSNNSTLIVLFLSIFIFSIISIFQTNYFRFLKKLTKWIELKKSFLSRSTLDWANISRKNIPHEKEVTNLEVDFNITGDRSLLHLIDFSSSDASAYFLRDLFINHKISRNEIKQRQNLVSELTSFNKFREKFLLTISLLNLKTKSIGNINNWINSESKISKIKFSLFFLIPLALINVFFISVHFFNIFNSVWMISSLVYLTVYYLSYKYYNSIGFVSDLIKEDLGKISEVYNSIGNTDFSKYENLKNLCEPIQSEKTSPTIILKQISRIIEFLTLRRHPFVWTFLLILFPFDLYLAYRLEKYKLEIGNNYNKWLNVWHQLEAYISLATFAKLNNEYKFPNLVENTFEFSAEKISHPLISKSSKIENDFSLSELGNIVIITGSNMSGKSTFLRTLGINICLAYSGTPVDAVSFNLPLLNVFSCIKVSDSIIDGISYFYSEVKRLKQLLEEFEKNDEKPIIFFIDEIFKGTNNIERRIGANSFIKSLIGKNGIGLVTTHDLDLVKLADDNKEIINYHFKENIKNDKMEFDYKLYKGPCPTTNALEIMKIEGLPIDYIGE